MAPGINHGYRDSGEHEVLVTLSGRNCALEIVLVDDGVAFDPSADAPEPPSPLQVDIRALRGMVGRCRSPITP